MAEAPSASDSDTGEARGPSLDRSDLTRHRPIQSAVKPPRDDQETPTARNGVGGRPRCRIHRKEKTPMQSGGRGGEWVMEFHPDEATRPSQLMGWPESGDMDQQVVLSFPTLQSAIQHAHRQGWEAEVVGRRGSRQRPRTYTDALLLEAKFPGIMI